MATVSKATFPKSDATICQGDIFRDVQYAYIDLQNNETVEIVEYTFPLAVVISQACDVTFMGEMISDQSGMPTKFMPSILMCPIYDVTTAKSAKHIDDAFSVLSIQKHRNGNDNLFNSHELGLAKGDWHYRYHILNVCSGNRSVLEDALIDFKHYFTVPASYLMDNRSNRVMRLDSLFAEQVTLKFSVFLSRVAIP